MNDLGWWPPMLRPLVKQYGADLVRRTGERLFGFPPDVFGASGGELVAMAKALAAETETQTQ